jgi:hypothetical protein
MFKLVEERTAWWPMSWKGVAEDGAIIENEIEMRFHVLGEKAFKELLAQAEENDDIAVLRRLVKDWRGIGDEEGKPLPFSDENLLRFLDLPNTKMGLATAYYRLMAATPEEREKNLGKSPDAGQPARAARRTKAKRSKT